MTKLPLMRWWPGDFYNDQKVMALSGDERRAYRELLDLMWMRGGYISDDDRDIARMLDMDIRTWRAKFKQSMLQFLQHAVLQNGRTAWTQRRLLDEYQKALDLVETRRGNAARSRRQKAMKSANRPSRPEAFSTPETRHEINAEKGSEIGSGQSAEIKPEEPLIAHSSDKKAAGAAANHQASEPVAVSSPALRSSRAEAENDESANPPDGRRDRDDQGAVPEPRRAADVHASTGGLLGKLEAHRRAKEGKER